MPTPAGTEAGGAPEGVVQPTYLRLPSLSAANHSEPRRPLPRGCGSRTGVGGEYEVLQSSGRQIYVRRLCHLSAGLGVERCDTGEAAIL